MLGGFETAAGRFDNEPNTHTQASEHVDECVGAEQVNPAPKQVTHPRLGHAENLCHFGLLETSGSDQLLNFNQQVRTNEQVLGLFRRKTQISEDVTARSSYFTFHLESTSPWNGRLFVS